LNRGRERVDVSAKRSDDEWHSLRHQTSNERDVTRKAVQLGDSDGAPGPLCSFQRSCELRPWIECIRTFASFNLGTFGNDPSLRLAARYFRPSQPHRKPGSPDLRATSLSSAAQTHPSNVKS
jgi:hypothetical protein